MKEKNNISISVYVNSHLYELGTYPGEYSNLMALLYDKLFLEEFGECKGIGRCGTCHVYLENAGALPGLRERNEEVTLSRLDDVRANSRLACQILINENVNGLKVYINV